MTEVELIFIVFGYIISLYFSYIISRLVLDRQESYKFITITTLLWPIALFLLIIYFIVKFIKLFFEFLIFFLKEIVKIFNKV